jgi:hypothetical protein
LTIRGIYGREMYDTWYKMTVMLESGLDIAPVITHRYPWPQFEEGFNANAFRRCWQGDPRLERPRLTALFREFGKTNRIQNLERAMTLNDFWLRVGEELRRHNPLTHPFYRAWKAGQLTRRELGFYASSTCTVCPHFRPISRHCIPACQTAQPGARSFGMPQKRRFMGCFIPIL